MPKPSLAKADGGIFGIRWVSNAAVRAIDVDGFAVVEVWDGADSGWRAVESPDEVNLVDLLSAPAIRPEVAELIGLA